MEFIFFFCFCFLLCFDSGITSLYLGDLFLGVVGDFGWLEFRALGSKADGDKTYRKANTSP